MRRKLTLYEILTRNENKMKELWDKLDELSQKYLPEDYHFTYCSGDGLMISRIDGENIYCTEEYLNKLLECKERIDFDETFRDLL